MMHLLLLVGGLSLTGLAAASPQVSGPAASTPTRVCKRLPTDPEWPSPSAWAAALPGVVARGPQGAITRPDYSLDARSVADVQAAVNFARTHNLRLTILSTGHDFLGRNDAPTGLSLMVSNLKGVKVLTSFAPSEKGAASPDYAADPVAGANKITVVPGQQPAVTFGAGVSTQELHDALAPSGLFTMGAAHGAVATAGGWGQTAGHGPFTSVYGLGVDQVLEYKVVTADGQLRVANAKVNQDLFWALRGGGGGTFGVVVEATVKAFPSPKITMTRFWMNATEAGSGKIFDAAAYLHSQYPEVNAKGMQGYYYIQENSMSATFLSIGKDGGIPAANATWQPVFQKLGSMPGVTKPITSFLEFYSMKQWFDAAFGPLPAKTDMGGGDGGHSHGSGVGDVSTGDDASGGHSHGEPSPAASSGAPTTAAAPTATSAGGHAHDDAAGGHAHRHRDAAEYHSNPLETRAPEEPESLRTFFKRHGADGTMEIIGKRPMDSRLLGASHLKHPRLAAALKASFPRMKHGILRGHLIAGGAVLKRADRETSVNPAWRSAYVHLIATGAEVPSIQPVRDLSPTSGSYANEAYYLEPNWKTAFWGSNYARLFRIKNQYDPLGVFWVTPGVAADQWSVRPDGRICPSSPSLPTAGRVELPPVSDNPNTRDPETEKWGGAGWPATQADMDATTARSKAALDAAWAAQQSGTGAPPPTSSGVGIELPGAGGHSHGEGSGGHDH